MMDPQSGETSQGKEHRSPCRLGCRLVALLSISWKCKLETSMAAHVFVYTGKVQAAWTT